MSDVHHLLLGAPGHGVTRLARQLLRPDDRVTAHPALATPGDLTALLDALPAPDFAPAIHLHLTDALLGPRPVETIEAIAAGRRLAITLHDVPQPLEGEHRYGRRLELYGQLASRADLVVVSSGHERRALGAAGGTAHAVLPLPIDARQVPAAPEAAPTVGLLGWIYPGKGHDRVLHALAALDRPATLVALGAAADGHPGIDDDLARLADELGVGFRCTGYLDDHALLVEAARVRVPVCAHRHVSASGTMGSWMAAGRRALVADGAYARELDARLPGALSISQALDRDIDEALRDPSSTVLDDRLEIGPSTPQAASAQAALLGRWAASSQPSIASAA